jgi:hypothetical protein
VILPSGIVTKMLGISSIFVQCTTHFIVIKLFTIGKISFQDSKTYTLKVLIPVMVKVDKFITWLLLITHRSKQMHYFYYLKLTTIYNISL